MLEKLQELVFPPTHPFQHSLIGSMEDLSAASLDDIAQFFATYYTPDNAVLSIAGDFDSSNARALIKQYFGPIPRGKGKPPLPPMKLPPVFGAPLREVVYDNVSLPRLFMYRKRHLREIVEETVAKLPEHHRNVFVLRELEGKSYEEIAEITECNLGTVKSRLNRARNSFAEIIAPYVD